MSLLLKAFPHGRPRPRAPRALLVLTLVMSLALIALPGAGTALAQPKRHHPAHARHAKAHAHRAAHTRPHKHAAKHASTKARRKTRPPRVPGQPALNYVMPVGSSFTFPNKGKRARLAIRNRVLHTIQSVWGGPRDALGMPSSTNGTIHIVTWTFDDWQIARALVAARKRGVTVQIMSAKKANRGHASWQWLRHRLKQRLYQPGLPATAAKTSFARTCRGSCRGRFGTAHAKYMLFTNVGAAHQGTVTMQTSSNLTSFAVSGQWNQAQVSYDPRVYNDFLTTFSQARLVRPLTNPYRSTSLGRIRDYFFPLYPHTQTQDPVDQILRQVRCTGATAGSTGRTIIRVNQYAIYGTRGDWLAKRLRLLWQQGCDMAILYTVTSRPVLKILRSPTGRGPIPMRQSVITDGYGTIVKYDHSKSMTIVGHWGKYPNAYLSFSGSANWADLAMGSDEQMQLLSDRDTALAYLRNFGTTWRQPTAHQPGYGVLPNITGRVIPTFSPDVPAGEPHWGKGIYRYMSPD